MPIEYRALARTRLLPMVLAEKLNNRNLEDYGGMPTGSAHHLSRESAIERTEREELQSLAEAQQPEDEPEPKWVKDYDLNASVCRRMSSAIEEQAILDFMTGVFIAEEVYAGTGEGIPRARIMNLLQRLHNNLGHPSLEVFLRILRTPVPTPRHP